MKYCLSIIAIAILLISCSHGITQHFPKDKKLTDPAEIIIIRNNKGDHIAFFAVLKFS